MKIKVILFLILVQSSVSFSQKLELDETKNFVHFNSGKTLYFTDYLNKKTPFLGSPKLEIGEEEYKLSKIKFYKNGTQFYASTANVDGSCSEFATRTEVGRINVYKAVRTYYSAPAPAFGSGFGTGFNAGFGGGYRTSKEVLFYNIGYENLKKATYANLAEDLVDNQESIILLQAYKKAKNREILLYVVGTAAMLGGMLTAFEKTGETTTSFDPNTNRFEEVDETNIKPTNLTIGLAGFALNIINYLAHRNKKKYIKQAIYEYNK